MRYVSVFSGVEAATVAWEPLGWEPVAFCEIDAFPSAVLAERFPDVPNLGDITEVDWKGFVYENGAVDLVVGGSPCQSFSVAGKREGLSGASGLMFEYVRCVRELRPRWFVWENVPGALSSEGGAAFGCLLSELDELGYGLAWRVLDAKHFGVPQQRRRVFLVGSLGTGRAAEVLIEPESIAWDSEKGEGAGAGRSAGPERGVDEGCGERRTTPVVIDRAAFNQGENAQYDPHIAESEVMDTLVARGPHAVCIEANGSTVVRRLTPRECERLNGFPDDWTLIPWANGIDTHRYKAMGNSMCINVMRWIGERIQSVESNM